MADISQVTVNSTTYDLKDATARKGYELIEDTRSSNVAAMTGTSNRLTSLENGTRILFHLAYNTAASTTLNLTLAGGGTTGAKKVYRQGTTQLPASIGIAGCILPLTYLTALDSGNGGWMMDNSYDSNTNTIGYQLRTNSTTLPTTDRTRYYRLLFTSADGKKWIPANTQYDNSATTTKTVNQKAINPFGRIVYLGNSTNYAADADIPASAIWDQYVLTFGYSFNWTGAALTLTTKTPVYVKCAPQSDGSAIMDSTTPIVQALPATNDGKIYIYLGIATSATQIELTEVNPVYYHDGTGIKVWTGGASGYTLPAASSSTLGGVKVGSGLSIDGSGVLSATGGGGGSIASTTSVLKGDGNGGAVAATAGTDYMAPVTLATVATSGSYADLSNKPTIPAAGLPAGGSSGQVLAKTSGADYAVGWVNQSGGGGGFQDVTQAFADTLDDAGVTYAYISAFTDGTVVHLYVCADFDAANWSIPLPAQYSPTVPGDYSFWIPLACVAETLTACSAFLDMSVPPDGCISVYDPEYQGSFYYVNGTYPLTASGGNA